MTLAYSATVVVAAVAAAAAVAVAVAVAAVAQGGLAPWEDNSDEGEDGPKRHWKEVSLPR